MGGGSQLQELWESVRDIWAQGFVEEAEREEREREERAREWETEEGRLQQMRLTSKTYWMLQGHSA